MLGHKRVRAVPEGDEEKGEGIAGITEHRGGRRSHPPAFVLTQTVKDMHVEDLPQRVGHKTRGGDTGDEQIEMGQRFEALPASHIKQ